MIAAHEPLGEIETIDALACRLQSRKHCGRTGTNRDTVAGKIPIEMDIGLARSGQLADNHGPVVLWLCLAVRLESLLHFDRFGTRHSLSAVVLEELAEIAVQLFKRLLPSVERGDLRRCSEFKKRFV